MERENISFYDKIRKGYLVLAKGMPGRFVVVDGSKDEASTEKKIWEALKSRIS